jgi:undecaprenyl-diphosphatase
MQGGAIAIVLLLNRRAWLLAAAATAGGVWYWVLVNLVHRPRPTAAQVLHVTEHPGASSFPSGHVIFIGLTAGILMLCLGDRYLPPRWRPVGWLAVAVIVVWAGLSRIYVGAHWPTDVIAGILIAAGWLSLTAAVGHKTMPR